MQCCHADPGDTKCDPAALMLDSPGSQQYQLNITVHDLKADEKFKLHFAGEDQTATVPALPVGVTPIPGASGTLPSPVPEGSQLVDGVERLWNGSTSGPVLVEQPQTYGDGVLCIDLHRCLSCMSCASKCHTHKQSNGLYHILCASAVLL